MFLEKLKRLHGEATEAPWVDICGPAQIHNGTRLVMAEILTEKTRSEMPERGYKADPHSVDNVVVAHCGTFQDDVSVNELHADAKIIALLRNKAEAIIALVEAANKANCVDAESIREMRRCVNNLNAEES